MRLSQSILSVAFVAWSTIATAAVQAEDGQKYELAYKFQPGEEIRYSIDHRASIRSTIEGTTQNAITKSDSVKLWQVVDVTPGEEIELVHLVERVKMTNKLPDRAEMVYDSTKNNVPPAGFEDAAAAVGIPLSIIRITPRGEIIDREVKHKQPAADTEAPITLLLPEQPVAIGDTWNEPRTVKVKTQDGAARDIKTRRHYKLAKVSSGVASIEVTYQVLTPVDPSIEAQLVQRLMKGVAKFDIEQGRILSQRMDVDERVLGFAGPSSSMHYVMRMEEEQVESEKKKVARRN